MVSCVSQDGVGGCLPSPRSLGVLVPPGVPRIPVMLGAAKVRDGLGRRCGSHVGEPHATVRLRPWEAKQLIWFPVVAHHRQACDGVGSPYGATVFGVHSMRLAVLGKGCSFPVNVGQCV